MFELSVHKLSIVGLFIYKWNNEFIFFQNNLFLKQGKIKLHFIKLCGSEYFWHYNSCFGALLMVSRIDSVMLTNRRPTYSFRVGFLCKCISVDESVPRQVDGM